MHIIHLRLNFTNLDQFQFEHGKLLSRVYNYDKDAPITSGGHLDNGLKIYRPFMERTVVSKISRFKDYIQYMEIEDLPDHNMLTDSWILHIIKKQDDDSYLWIMNMYFHNYFDYLVHKFLKYKLKFNTWKAKRKKQI